MIGLTHKGLSEELKALKESSKRVKSNVDKFGKESINVAEKVMQNRVPVDTGELSNSINNQGLSVNITAPHTQAVEYGTHRSPAQPFIRPAIDEMEKYIEKNIGGVVDDTIQ